MQTDTASITIEEFEDISEGDEWEAVGPELNVGKHRWYDEMQQAYKHKTTGELIVLITCDGNNETVDMDYDDYPARRYPAEAYEFTETRYRAVR